MTAASVFNQRWFLRLSRLRLVHQYFSLVRHVEMSLQAKLDNQEKKQCAVTQGSYTLIRSHYVNIYYGLYLHFLVGDFPSLSWSERRGGLDKFMKVLLLASLTSETGNFSTAERIQYVRSSYCECCVLKKYFKILQISRISGDLTKVSPSNL